MKRLIALTLFISAACGLGAPAQSSPSPRLPLLGYVSDFANILSDDQEQHLTRQLERLEQDTRHQMVVVTVQSLNGQEIDSFTLSLARSWKIGRAKVNDGVVLLVAPNERKVRIEVGYGLEKTLTDDRCSEIIQTKILPRFIEGDMPGGIDVGVDALVEALK